MIPCKQEEYKILGKIKEKQKINIINSNQSNELEEDLNEYILYNEIANENTLNLNRQNNNNEISLTNCITNYNETNIDNSQSIQLNDYSNIINEIKTEKNEQIEIMNNEIIINDKDIELEKEKKEEKKEENNEIIEFEQNINFYFNLPDAYHSSLENTKIKSKEINKKLNYS